MRNPVFVEFKMSVAPIGVAAMTEKFCRVRADTVVGIQDSTAGGGPITTISTLGATFAVWGSLDEVSGKLANALAEREPEAAKKAA